MPGLVAPADRIDAARRLAARARGADPAVREQIAAQLTTAFRQEESPLVREELVRAIGQCRTPAALEVLGEALQASQPGIRVAACEALGQLGGPQASGRLAEVLASDVDFDVRLAAAKALGQTGDPGALAALGSALEDPDPAMQLQAIRSLQAITGRNLGNDVNRWRQFVAQHTSSDHRPVSVAERPSRPR